MENKIDGETLEDFGYHFNDAGELRQIKSGGGFVFDVFNGDKRRNQQRYENIGKAVEKQVYKLLESETHLEKRFIPEKAKADEAKGFIFVSKNLESFEKVMIIVHGSGVVRAGQWSRRLIINHSLYSGTQLPYIKRARELGYGVIVTNTNQNHDDDTHERIPASRDPVKHFDYVWKHIVKRLSAKYIGIVAHSYGGAVTVEAASKHKDFINKVFAVALTDSVHSYQKGVSKQVMNWFQNNVVNWASSREELDTELRSSKYDCTVLSAGTSVHEETSWKAIDSVWKFIQERLEYAEKSDRMNSQAEKNNDEASEKADGKEADPEEVDNIVNKKSIEPSLETSHQTAEETSSEANDISGDNLDNDVYMNSQPTTEDETEMGDEVHVLEEMQRHEDL